MIAPPIPSNEKKRLQAVKSYNLLDTLPEKDYDNITKLVATICNVPISLVTILDSDRNFLKSHFGIEITESPRELSFCGHAILDTSEIFIIKDARKDNRFKGNPLVTEMGAIFYAGVPLKNKENYPLGTLCVFDTKPRDLTVDQKSALISLAQQVMSLFESRKKNKILQIVQAELKIKNTELKSFAGIVSHDMKMPLANIIMTTDMLRVKYAPIFDEQALKYLDYLKQSSFKLSDYISGMLVHYESDTTIFNTAETFDLHEFLEEIIDLLNIHVDCEINLPDDNADITCNKIALKQIFINLITNSIKYNNNEQILISIQFMETEDFYVFSVIDNGIGIPKGKIDSIFALFSTLETPDRNGNKGNGIGLSTVKKLITGLGGEINVTSKLHKGSTFRFSVKKTNS